MRPVVRLSAVALLMMGVVFGLLVSRVPPERAAAAGDPSIAAAGDIACDPASADFNGGDGQNGRCQQKATYDLLTQGGFAAVLALGDNQYFCGGYQAFAESYALSWGKLLAKTYPVVGNHEYLTAPDTDGTGTGCDSSNINGAGYFKYYADAAQEGAPGEGWYSFDIGKWHLVALNSNCGNAGGCDLSSSQGAWLERDLAAHGSQCLLAYWHIPFWSSGGRAAQNVGPFVQQLYEAHADVILNGHDHLYERFALQDAAGNLDPRNGVREFVVGTGGANHTPVVAVAPNSQVRDASSFGVLELTLHDASYDWRFKSVSGTVLDSGTEACHNAVAVRPPPTTTSPPTTTTPPTTTSPPTMTTPSTTASSPATTAPFIPATPDSPGQATTTLASAPVSATTVADAAETRSPLVADLAAHIVFQRRTVPVYERESIRIEVENSGTGVSSAATRLTIRLPREATVVSLDAGCRGTQPIRCLLASIPAGASIFRVFTIRAAAEGEGKVRVMLTNADGSGASDGIVSAVLHVVRSTSSAGCVAPDVDHAPYQSAVRAIERARCSVGRVTARVVRSRDVGRVVSQRPLAGAKLKRGARIDLVMGRHK